MKLDDVPLLRCREAIAHALGKLLQCPEVFRPFVEALRRMGVDEDAPLRVTFQSTREVPAGVPGPRPGSA